MNLTGIRGRYLVSKAETGESAVTGRLWLWQEKLCPALGWFAGMGLVAPALGACGDEDAVEQDAGDGSTQEVSLGSPTVATSSSSSAAPPSQTPVANAGSGGAPAIGSEIEDGGSNGGAGGVSDAAAGGVGGELEPNSSGGAESEAGAGGKFASGGARGESGETGTGGAGGEGPTEVFNPCPQDGTPCRVMPLGDSITDGVGSSHRSGYRPELFRLAATDGASVTFVGSASDQSPTVVAGLPFPGDHEGHSSFTIDDTNNRDGLYPRVVGWLAEHPPEIVTLMIGTNDLNNQSEVETAPQRLGLLLDRIAESAPEALVVVAQVVPSRDDGLNERVAAFNAEIPGLLEERVAAGQHLLMVDMFGAFTDDAGYKTNFLADKLHPNDAGYEVMAAVWYDAIGALLPRP